MNSMDIVMSFSKSSSL